MQSFSLKPSAAIVHLGLIFSIVLIMVSEHEGMLHNIYVLESV